MKEQNAGPRNSRAVDKSAGASFTLVHEILQTREARKMLGFLIPEVVKLWAGNSALKRKLTGPVGAIIQKGISPSGVDDQYPSLLEDPEQVKRLGAELPAVMTEIFAGFDTLLETVEKLDASEKEKLVSDLVAGLSRGSSGTFLTRLARLLNEVHEQNPHILSQALEPGFRRWIEAADFGELRDFCDQSFEDAASLVKMVNDVLWEYPAKLVLLLSFLPDLANILVMTLKESVGRFNQVSPDLVADIVLSLFRSLNGQELGRMVNELTELVRKLHTGSALIGDPGNPRFPADLKQTLKEAFSVVDPEILSKARLAISEDREALENALTDMLSSHSTVWKHNLKHYADLKNPRLRARRYHLSMLAEQPGEEMMEVLAEGIGGLDAQEAAEILNLAFLLINRVRDLKPETLTLLADQFVNSLDLFELNHAAEWMSRDLDNSLRTAGRALMPSLIQAACRIMEPADDEFEESMASARDMLRSILMPEEVTP